MSSGPTSRRSPGPRPGERCTRCHRRLVGPARVRRTLSGRWRHESCGDVPAPSEADFAELASLLMEQHPWPRVQPLLTQLAEATAELEEVRSRAGRVPGQAGPPRIETMDEREQDLVRRTEELHHAVASERSWKARRLAVEWADGG